MVKTLRERGKSCSIGRNKPRSQLSPSVPPDQLFEKESSGYGPDPAAVRGLVGLGRWSYCLSAHGVKNVRNRLWVRGSQRGLEGGRGGRGSETKTGPDGVTTYSKQPKRERLTTDCLAELPSIIKKLVLAFSDAGISGLYVRPSHPTSQDFGISAPTLPVYHTCTVSILLLLP